MLIRSKKAKMKQVEIFARDIFLTTAAAVVIVEFPFEINPHITVAASSADGAAVHILRRGNQLCLSFERWKITDDSYRFSLTLWDEESKWGDVGMAEIKVSEFGPGITAPHRYRNSHLEEQLVDITGGWAKSPDPFLTQLRAKIQSFILH